MALDKAETQARLERVLWDAVVDLAAEGYDHDDVDGIVSDVFREIRENKLIDRVNLR